MKRGFTLRRAPPSEEEQGAFLRSPRKASAPPAAESPASPRGVSSPRVKAFAPIICPVLLLQDAETLPVALVQAAGQQMTTPGGPPSLKHTRAAPSVDTLVAAASALLRSLKTARGALAMPEKLVELVLACVVAVRTVAAQTAQSSTTTGSTTTGSTTTALQAQLLAVIERVPLLLERPVEAALSQALQEAVDLAVLVRALKDRTGEGVVLENGLTRLEAEMTLLADCLGTSAVAVGPGVYEGLVASIGEMTKMLAHGKVASRPMLAVSFANVVESGTDILRFGRQFLGSRAESEAKMLQGKTMHVGVHVAALLRAKLALLDEGDSGSGAATAEAVLRAKMMETESSVNSLTSAISYEQPAVSTTAPSSGSEPTRTKGFTLYRKPTAVSATPEEQQPSDWLSSGWEAKGVSGLLFCLSQLGGRLADLRSFASSSLSGMESSFAVAVEAQSSLGVFPSDVVAGAVTRYLERHGPLFAGTASRCAAQMLECPDEDQKELGLLFCILSLPEPRQKVLWALLEMCSGLLKLSKSAWTPQSLSAVFEPIVVGGESHVFPVLLRDPGRIQRAGSAHGEVFRMSGNGALVGCAVLPFVADLMVREEYRLLEPRVLEVVLMTHTVYCASAQLLALLLQLYARHREHGGTFGKHSCNRVLDAVGFWFMSPLYLRPDHLNDEFIGTWQAFLQKMIASGIREAEKVTLKKFTQLLSSNYARLEAQMSEKQARQAASAAAATPELDLARKWLVLEPREIQLLAESMTRVDSQMFCDVQPFELFSNAHLDPTRAPGFARMTLQFNTIGNWVAHCLLAPESKSGDRATMISVFVALAKALCDLNNFHGSYAVLCGLNASPVSRLAKSWSKVTKRVQTTLSELMELNSHTKNYKVYREHMRMCRPPIIPQIGVISRDLFGLEENNVDMLEKRFVNLEKSRVLEKVAFEMLQLQATPHVFPGPPDDALVAFFGALPLATTKISEKMLYERSLALEKRAE